MFSNIGDLENITIALILELGVGINLDLSCFLLFMRRLIYLYGNLGAFLSPVTPMELMELIHYLGNQSLGSPKVDEFSDQFTVRAGALFIPTAL